MVGFVTKLVSSITTNFVTFVTPIYSVYQFNIMSGFVRYLGRRGATGYPAYERYTFRPSGLAGGFAAIAAPRIYKYFNPGTHYDTDYPEIGGAGSRGEILPPSVRQLRRSRGFRGVVPSRYRQRLLDQEVIGRRHRIRSRRNTRRRMFYRRFPYNRKR